MKLSDARLAELEAFAAGHRGLGITLTHIEIDDLDALLAEVRDARNATPTPQIKPSRDYCGRGVCWKLAGHAGDCC